MKNPLAGKSDCKTRIFLVIVLVVFFMYEYTVFLSNISKHDEIEKVPLDYYEIPIMYLINTPTCKIPDIDPFSKDVAKYVYKVKYLKCSDLELLTYIEKQNGVVTLRVNTSLLHLYSALKITCCYSKINRKHKENPDNIIIYSPCTQFEEYAVLSHPHIRVNCSDSNRTVYTNVHAVTIPTKEQLKFSGNKKGAFSVIIVGIDTMSKLNLKRTMPKTTAYLNKHFLNLRGYNKIGDNTYPNVMAILTGQNEEQIEERCGVGGKIRLKECGFIWDAFKDLNYVTAYAEDTCHISTFNYGRPGFVKPPTDHYYRPYMIAAERLPSKEMKNSHFCAGPESTGERILNIVKDFSVTFKNVPKFGFFWMNSFSHEDINVPSAMDEKVLEFFNDTSFKSSLEDTFMIFLSDHGFRFGPMRYTHTGWLEERLPMIYFYIPHSFRHNFPEKYYSLLLNSLKLTSPYDIHNTLQDLLQLASNTYVRKKSVACPKCQSLFKEINKLRICKDAAIDQHWCTCTSHTYINPKHPMAHQAASLIIKEVNDLVRNFPDGGKCVEYSLQTVISAGVSEYSLNYENQTIRYFFVIAEANPAAEFEGTVEVQSAANKNYFKLLGDISRLDKFSDTSYCVKDVILEKYCYCD